MEREQTYTTGELSGIAGISVRTLRYYDGIGLLSPGRRNANGYRVYGEEELLRLQQIMFYRELSVPLEEIAGILDDPGFDLLAALEGHRETLAREVERIGRLLETVSRTVARMKGIPMLSDEELYEGFEKTEIEAIKRESEAKYGQGKAYKESQKRVAAMTKEDFTRVKRELSEIDEAAKAALIKGFAADSPETQAVMDRKFAHLRHFYEPSPELFAGLGQTYAEDERFRAHYEAMKPGLADYLRDAMGEWAKRHIDS